jgi:hypothetical protein
MPPGKNKAQCCKNTYVNDAIESLRKNVTFLRWVVFTLFMLALLFVILHNTVPFEPNECLVDSDCYDGFNCVNNRCDCTWRNFSSYPIFVPYKCDRYNLSRPPVNPIGLVAEICFLLGLIIFLLLDIKIHDWVQYQTTIQEMKDELSRVRGMIGKLKDQKSKE